MSRPDPDAAGDPAQAGIDDLLYTAVGFAVLGFQRLQWARRELGNDLRARTNELQPSTIDALATVVDAIDAGLAGLAAAMPPPLDEPATLTRAAVRHLREGLLDQSAGSTTPAGSTATSTTSPPAIDDTKSGASPNG